MRRRILELAEHFPEVGHDPRVDMRERKCIASGEVRSEARLIRFVVSPDGEVVPDVAAKLPGRGMWLTADRKSLETALAMFALAIDPKHIKTLLNVGIVRAFGKQDLAGAGKAWQQVVDLAPSSPEGQAAKKGLEGIKSASGGK